MVITLDCIACLVNSFTRLLKDGTFPQELKEPAMRRLLAFLARTDYDRSPPELGREMYRVIREMLHSDDPYREIKEKYNRLLLDLYPQLAQRVAGAADPFDMAMRLAIAGNVIDFAPQADPDIKAAIERVIRARLAIDDSAMLRRDLERSRRLLYVGDNCGEIVLDRLFLETIKHPDAVYAVRGEPVINDITLHDARAVDMSSYARVITTGDDAPGAVWETASEEFREELLRADVVLAKGQGNLEGLIDVEHNIYFLLMVKCDTIAGRLGVRSNDFVVQRSPAVAG